MTEAELAELLERNPDLKVIDAWSTLSLPVIQLTIASEYDLQAAVIAECDRRAHTDVRYSMVVAVPNGMVRRGHRVDAGVRAGFPDLAILLPRHGYHAAFVELKHGKGKVSLMQQRWLDRLKAEGYYSIVIWDSVEETMEFISWYVSGVLPCP